MILITIDIVEIDKLLLLPKLQDEHSNVQSFSKS